MAYIVRRHKSAADHKPGDQVDQLDPRDQPRPDPKPEGNCSGCDCFHEGGEKENQIRDRVQLCAERGLLPQRPSNGTVHHISHCAKKIEHIERDGKQTDRQDRRGKQDPACGNCIREMDFPSHAFPPMGNVIFARIGCRITVFSFSGATFPASLR